jgi:hypothetical protein
MLVHLFYLGVWFWPTCKGLQIPLKIWFENLFGKLEKKWRIERNPLPIRPVQPGSACSSYRCWAARAEPEVPPPSSSRPRGPAQEAAAARPSLLFRWQSGPAVRCVFILPLHMYPIKVESRHCLRFFLSMHRMLALAVVSTKLDLVARRRHEYRCREPLYRVKQAAGCLLVVAKLPGTLCSFFSSFARCSWSPIPCREALTVFAASSVTSGLSSFGFEALGKFALSSWLELCRSYLLMWSKTPIRRFR